MPTPSSGVHARAGAHVGVEDAGVVEQHFDFFERVQRLDEARVVEVERAFDHRAEALVVLGELGVGFGRGAAVGHVQARQRAHAVDRRRG